jgi:hypothetical protein
VQRRNPPTWTIAFARDEAVVQPHNVKHFSTGKVRDHSGIGKSNCHLLDTWERGQFSGGAILFLHCIFGVMQPGIFSPHGCSSVCAVRSGAAKKSNTNTPHVVAKRVRATSSFAAKLQKKTNAGQSQKEKKRRNRIKEAVVHIHQRIDTQKKTMYPPHNRAASQRIGTNCVDACTSAFFRSSCIAASASTTSLDVATRNQHLNTPERKATRHEKP